MIQHMQACYQVSHLCPEICGYCAKDGNLTEKCGDKCGHSGKHNCRRYPHTCGEKCSLSAYGGCQENCRLIFYVYLCMLIVTYYM